MLVPPTPWLPQTPVVMLVDMDTSGIYRYIEYAWGIWEIEVHTNNGNRMAIATGIAPTQTLQKQKE